MVLNKIHGDATKAVSEYVSSVSSYNHSVIFENFKNQLSKEGFNIIEVLYIVSDNSLESTAIFKTDFKVANFNSSYGTCFVLNHNSKKKSYELSIGYADLDENSYSLFITGDKISKTYVDGKYTIGINIQHGDIYDLVTDLKYQFNFTEFLTIMNTCDFNTKLKAIKFYERYFSKPEFKDAVYNVALNLTSMETVLKNAMTAFVRRNRTIDSFIFNFNTLLHKVRVVPEGEVVSHEDSTVII